MNSRTVSPRTLAHELARDDALSSEAWLGDITTHPDLYYSDYVEICREQGVLPLSMRAWRRACHQA